MSTTGTKTGCMKWYTFLDSNTSSTVNMILDHNTTAVVNAKTPEDFSVIEAVLTNDTSTWSNGLNPRFITVEEIAEIIGQNSFLSDYSTYFNLDASYNWLYE